MEILTFEVDVDMFLAALFQSAEDVFKHSLIFIRKIVKVNIILDPMLNMNMINYRKMAIPERIGAIIPQLVLHVPAEILEKLRRADERNIVNVWCSVCHNVDDSIRP